MIKQPTNFPGPSIAPAVWASAVAAAVIFSAPMIPYLAKPTDLWDHIEYAKAIHQLSDIASPHFLFQILLIAMSKVTHLSYEASAIAVLSLCYSFMAALIAVRLTTSFPHFHGVFVLAVSLSALMASHIFLQTAFSLNFYYGYIAPIVYHNPTQILSKALALAIMFSYFALVLDERGNWACWRILLPIGIVLSAIAKPSFLIAFLPCAGAVELYRAATGSWRTAARNLVLTALPAICVLALQYRMTFNSDGSGGGLAFAPFLVYGGAVNLLVKLPGSLFFPLVAAIVFLRERYYAPNLLFTWFIYAIGMLISVCFVEAGPRMMQGNFAWTGQTVTFLLYVESTICLTAIAWDRSWYAWGALALHVLFGIIWFSAAFFMPLGTFL
jgi:hypothetical protein